MRFALIDNQKVEAKFGLKGLCPGCLQPVVAKCGKQRIHHWAHSRRVMCDGWWEPETEWHRSWKNNYPTEWQEVFLPDEKTGEKHIADVHTIHGLVIEFQHSHITSEERNSREKFYKNMVWVVDGTRLKRDYARFRKNVEHFKQTNTKGFFIVEFPDEVFPASWLDSSVPVIFDFRDTSVTKEQDLMRNTLWCLLPKRVENHVVVVGIGHGDFINTTHNRRELFPTPESEKQQRQTPPKVPPMRREPQYIMERGRWKKRRRF